jgi:hypothetical protein
MKTTARRRLSALGAALLAAAALGAAGVGCAPVRPWERSLLAHRCMTPDSRPEETKARLHMLGARESARGAAGETGGGCGCK